MRSISNPPNPWRGEAVEWLGEIPELRYRVFHDECRSALVANKSPDVPFRLGLNPYRGCQHACAYCYARPSHEHLDFGAGTDFDTQLVVKPGLPEVLRRELAGRRGGPELVGLSGITDCYQPLEASYRITRGCLEALADFRYPVGIITKGVLIERDLDLLLRVRDRAGLRVFLSIPFARDSDSRLVEPVAPPSTRRFETIRRLSEAGIDVGLAIAPVIPGWNDSQIPELCERAAEAGAGRAFMVLLRLPGVVQSVFEERLRAIVPDSADRVMASLTEARGGEVAEARFGHRMRGVGPRFAAIEQLFRLYSRKHGLDARDEPDALVGIGADRVRRTRPSVGGSTPESGSSHVAQGTLFDAAPGRDTES